MANVVSIERRDAHTRIEHLDDGTHRAIIQRGQHYFNRDTGKFEDCDNNIYPDTIVPGFTHNSKAGEARTRFAPGGKFRFGLKHPLFVTYTPHGANSVTPTINGNRAHFANLWPSVDVELTKFPEGTKEDIILKDASAPSSFTWDLSEIAGVTPTPSADGGLDYVETLTGAIVGRIPAPTVHDAAGVPGPVALTYAAGAVTIAVDSTWLADAARVWPVTIDPTTVTIQPDASAGIDAYVDSNNATTNYGTATTIKISGTTLFGLAQFSMPSVPADAGIASGDLSLYKTTGDGNTGTKLSAYRITSNWAESSVTYNTRPSYASTAIVTLTGLDNSQINVWRTLAIRSAVVDWIKNGVANYGVWLSSEGTAGGDYNSSDFTTDATLRPKLVIVYTAAPTATLTNPTGTQAAPTQINDDLTPTVTGSYASTDSVSQAKYRFRVLDELNNLIADQGVQTGAANSWTVPTDLLKYGTKYQVEFYVEDANGGYATTTAWMQPVMSALTGLTATADSANAKINLTWTAHTGENLAGYRVYRRTTGGTTWTRLNRTLVTSASYTDDAAASGQSYDYYVTAVATDGYESPASATVTQTVTFTGAWIDSLKLEATPRVFEAQDEWVGSVQRVLGRSTPVVFRRSAGRKLRISGYCTSKASMDSLRNTLVPGVHRYVDALGEVYRFELTGPLSYPKQAPFPTASTTVYEWSFECVEVM